MGSTEEKYGNRDEEKKTHSDELSRRDDCEKSIHPQLIALKYRDLPFKDACDLLERHAHLTDTPQLAQAAKSWNCTLLSATPSYLTAEHECDK